MARKDASTPNMSQVADREIRTDFRSDFQARESAEPCMKRIVRGALGLAAISGGAQQAAGSRVGSEGKHRSLHDVDQIYSDGFNYPLVVANFHRADANDDGVLSPTEFEKFNSSIEASIKEATKEQLNRTMFNYGSSREVYEQIQRKLLDLARSLSEIFPFLAACSVTGYATYLLQKMEALKHDLDIEKEYVSFLENRRKTTAKHESDEIKRLKRAYLDRVAELSADVRIAERKALDAELLSTGYEQALGYQDTKIKLLEIQLESMCAELAENNPQ